MSLTPAPSTYGPLKTEVRANSDGTFTLLRDGQPFFVKGAGGRSHLDLLVASGGNSIRTWSISALEELVDGKPFIDRCHELGLGVTAGIWIGHSRHGADYTDATFLNTQREATLAGVRKYKDHPAILCWGLGNEMEGPDGSETAIWKELNELAALIKNEDPNHPVMTVIAGANPPKILAALEHYPNVDILGVNSYGPAPEVPKTLRDWGWNKPFMLTEFGPIGHWEIEKTPWGVPIESTSLAKAKTYLSTYEAVVSDGQGLCLGTYAFLWGNKQETTPTWYGMFLPTGEKLPSVDAMTKAWTGHWPDHRCPHLLAINAPITPGPIKPEQEFTITATVADAEAGAFTYQWVVMRESTDIKEGGDFETTPPTHPECILEASGNSLRFRAPQRPGAYRLFLYIRDGRGGASAENIPFLVQE